MRITGGALGGRRLGKPLAGTRPTADRVREALFARLEVTGAQVLDLFAGTGSLGIEALSRGASSAVFVDHSIPGVRALQLTLEGLDLLERTQVIRDDAFRAIRRLATSGRSFDLVLLDPPYVGDDAERAMEALTALGVLPSGGTLILEGARRSPGPEVEGLTLLDERCYGETRVSRFEVD
ncbi:16S rRNA (guanine(966)-N(2))-methyltransferase RsmD [Myxococcota bacterium]|nr:16S rRNA (guanine(966)-N(2))-methyltransferase RsmD [Myxococcota bacterium]